MQILIIRIFVGRRGVVGSTLAFGPIGHEFESEHLLFYIILHRPSASRDRCCNSHWTIQSVHSASIPSGEGESISSVPVVVLRV